MTFDLLGTRVCRVGTCEDQPELDKIQAYRPRHASICACKAVCVALMNPTVSGIGRYGSIAPTAGDRRLEPSLLSHSDTLLLLITAYRSG